MQPLGILEGYSFESCQVVLQPGDALLLFTDGVTDAQDKNSNGFTPRGLVAAVQGAGAARPRGLVERVVKAVQQHASGRDAFDDLTLVCLGRLG